MEKMSPRKQENFHYTTAVIK